MGQNNFVKWDVKDSVFSILFEDKKNLLSLYQSFHPEDVDITEADLNDVTIRNVLVNDIYNDLGFTVHDKLMVLVEAQSTWSLNIVLRILMYLSETYKRYEDKYGWNLYGEDVVNIPKPELYVIYVGDESVSDSISFKEVYFPNEECPLDLNIHVLKEGFQSGDIVDQYIEFCRIQRDVVSRLGRTKDAINDIIAVCKQKGILVDFIRSREMEVRSIMDTLFDQEMITRNYLKDVTNKVTQQVTQDSSTKFAKKLLQDGKYSIEEIAGLSELPLKEVEALAKELR
ncbi:MAG: hypothetical protein IJ661_09240 [Lachnospiraceae bacterium]|nr:hypothetical protein [Lachnospiraceae bacterium]